MSNSNVASVAALQEAARPVNQPVAVNATEIVQSLARSADLIITAQVTPNHLGEFLAEQKRRAMPRLKRKGLLPLSTVARVAASGMGRGFRQTSQLNAEWDIAGTCQSPVPVELLGSKHRLVGERHVRTGGTFALLMQTRCRKCPDCLRRRRNLWAYRAKVEIGESVRTWFATFTCSPHHHFVMHMRASARLARGGTILDRLPTAERDYEVTSEYQREITLYFKRLRKRTGANLRYICVKESHKSGLPHFHALIHEVSAVLPVRHADLTASWSLGFTKFKLVSCVKSAWYVAKYLAKEVGARVRASIRYGSRSQARVKSVYDQRRATLDRENNQPLQKQSFMEQANKETENDNSHCKVQSNALKNAFVQGPPSEARSGRQARKQGGFNQTWEWVRWWITNVPGTTAHWSGVGSDNAAGPVPFGVTRSGYPTHQRIPPGSEDG